VPTQSADQILADLRAGRFAPVYVLQGEEPFEIDRVADFIEANALAEHERSFNQVVLYGRDADVAAILGNARRYPMMADRSVVIVREAQTVADLERDPGQKLLLRYLEQPQPTTVLVLCHKHRALDGRKALAKAAEKSAVLLTTKKLYENQVPAWLTGYVKERGASITPEAVMLLVQRAGTDLARLASEVEKLLTGATAGKAIDKEAVLAGVGMSREFTIFELQTALIQGNGAHVERIIRFFESNPKDNPVIPQLALLFGFFARLMVLHQQRASGPINWKAALGNRAFLQREYEQALQRFPNDRTRRIIGYLRRADLQSKGIEGGSMSDADIMRELVLGILRG
jgi:DNA polymerase III subunit delta